MELMELMVVVLVEVSGILKLVEQKRLCCPFVLNRRLELESKALENIYSSELREEKGLRGGSMTTTKRKRKKHSI